MGLDIKGFQANTLIDWEGKIASTIFLPGCNLRCPFCHAAALIEHPQELDSIPFSDIESFLKERSGWIDGVVVCGGEPTIHPELPAFIKRIRSIGPMVKLDTNGTNPSMLRSLIDARLIEYVAMDIKAPLEKERYSEACGRLVDIDKIKESIHILIDSGIDHEFRTTIVPTILDKRDILNMARSLGKGRRYILQQFAPHDTLDPKMLKLTPFPDKEIMEMARLASEHLPTTFRNV